jgi:hypothetical protein
MNKETKRIEMNWKMNEIFIENAKYEMDCAFLYIFDGCCNDIPFLKKRNIFNIGFFNSFILYVNKIKNKEKCQENNFILSYQLLLSHIINCCKNEDILSLIRIRFNNILDFYQKQTLIYKNLIEVELKNNINARIIQKHVVHWLYSAPNGPMFKKELKKLQEDHLVSF